MNTRWLLDSMVRQMTVLLAQVATSGGVRAPVAHIANQVFVDLSRELAAQGVSRKVSADMFGMALRVYLRKLRRLSESSTDTGHTLWKAVLDFISNRDTASRAEVLRRFQHDDEALVRSVLLDLNESGLVFVSGLGANVTYRAATEAELSRMRGEAEGDGLDELVWVLVYREGPLSRASLARSMRSTDGQLDTVLDRLISAGRVQRSERDGVELLGVTEVSVPLEASVGWEAAIFDHFQAMVQTICQRLGADDRVARAADIVGGSTYTFDVHPAHPLASEVFGALQRFRQEHSELRTRVEQHNAQHALPPDYEQVVMYGGQCVLERSSANLEENDGDA
jgi:hypothetical protein